MEELVHASVPSNVRLELLNPPGLIGPLDRAVYYTRVPKTPIDVHGDSLGGKD